jgi:hypothetical protein
MIYNIDVVLGNLHLNRLSIRSASKSSEGLKTFLQFLLVSDVLREKSGFFSETGWRLVHGLSMQRKWEVQLESTTAVCLVLDATGGGRAT